MKAPQSSQSLLRRSRYARNQIVGLAQGLQLPLRSLCDALGPAAHGSSLRGDGRRLPLRLLHQVLCFLDLRSSVRCDTSHTANTET